MDEEAAFQSALDADPADATTRGVYADWLEEFGGERAGLAAGYRALAVLGVWPAVSLFSTPTQCRGFTNPDNSRAPKLFPWAVLPDDWFVALAMLDEHDHENKWWCWFGTRRAAESAAALAWLALPAARRAALLAPA
jgi:uncharacterized protein (TIGR02996 family)